MSLYVTIKIRCLW